MSGGRSNRQRGDYFERQCRDALIATGWLVVRAAGSYGPADLVALRTGYTPLLISCKLDGYLRPHERADLLAAGRLAGGRPMVASRPVNGHVSLSLVYRQGHSLPVDTLKVPPRRPIT
jgi:Holliday junction resolvase